MGRSRDIAGFAPLILGVGLIVEGIWIAVGESVVALFQIVMADFESLEADSSVYFMLFGALLFAGLAVFVGLSLFRNQGVTPRTRPFLGAIGVGNVILAGYAAWAIVNQTGESSPIRWLAISVVGAAGVLCFALLLSSVRSQSTIDV
jgi:hypothetical protein